MRWRTCYCTKNRMLPAEVHQKAVAWEGIYDRHALFCKAAPAVLHSEKWGWFRRRSNVVTTSKPPNRCRCCSSKHWVRTQWETRYRNDVASTSIRRFRCRYCFQLGDRVTPWYAHGLRAAHPCLCPYEVHPRVALTQAARARSLTHFI